jgi:hypothetical protein
LERNKAEIQLSNYELLKEENYKVNEGGDASK